MRVRRVSAVVAVLSLAFVMSACSRSAPEIPDEQVEAWRVLGEEMVPAATVIDVRASQETTMAGNFNVVDIEVGFADFADLKGSYQAAEEFEASVNEQAPRAEVISSIINQGAPEFEAEVASRLVDNVPGLEHARATSRIQIYPETEPLALWATSYLYVKDPAVVDPAWLDDVADHTQQVASDAGGRVDSLIILPADAVGLNLAGPEIDQAMIPVQDLQQFEGSGAASGCVQTDSWAYDVSNPRIIVHPASDPGGACA